VHRLDRAMASQPVLSVPPFSKIGSKWMPASSVFHRPPLAVRT